MIGLPGRFRNLYLYTLFSIPAQAEGIPTISPGDTVDYFHKFGSEMQVAIVFERPEGAYFIRVPLPDRHASDPVAVQGSIL